MSQDLDTQLAEDLDALLQELQAGDVNLLSHDASTADATFVAALLQLSHEIQPDSRFEADLEKRLLAHTTGHAADGTRRRLRRRAPVSPTPHGHSTRWRRWMSLAAMMLLALILLTPRCVPK